MTSRLHISIGPVQGFVAQSRRTRDLWGSSYLLSFLSAKAMHGMVEAAGHSLLSTEPVVAEDPLYRWVSGKGGGTLPRIGSLPNQFAVEIEAGGDPQAVARAGVAALNNAWQQVCGAVRQRFVEHACALGAGTEAIWNRQITSFWDVTWTVGNPDAGSLLARRKHWRSYRPPDEPGDKCTVMHDWQELSGHVRSRGPACRDKQRRFWESVRERMGMLDLRDNEQLCAIALVKRLFPKVARQALRREVSATNWPLGGLPTDDDANEALRWEVSATNWPSTVHMGARPWIRRVQTAAPEAAQRYAEVVKTAVKANDGSHDVLSERQWPDAETNDSPANNSPAGDFPRLDANYYHRESVASGTLCPLNTNESGRAQLDQQLKALYDAKDENGNVIGAPSSFYALLLADGDQLGKLASQLGKKNVGNALARFTEQVPEIVKQHGGETIYAGGDDVLAMQPVPEALRCAARLAELYREAFAEADRNGGTGPGAASRDVAGATLSAAVVFAHIRLPLSTVIGAAHRLLDKEAKDGNGRNSLAVGVLKPGGLHAQWVTTWQRRQPSGTPSSAVALLDDLVARLTTDAAEPGVSSALIYRIREVLTRLCGWQSWQPGSWGAVPADLDVTAFLRAEIGHSLEVRTGDVDKAGEHTATLTNCVWQLMQQSSSAGNNNADNGKANDVSAVAGMDALLLARFLAHTTQEEVI